MPLRQTRAPPRTMRPSVTNEPAMTVLLPTRKIWRTSARPSTTSTIDRLEETLERGAEIVGQLVDDVVQADVDALGLGRPTGGVGDLRVEADDDRVRGGGQHDVVVGDVAGALEQDVEADLLLVELLQRVGDGAQRAGHVRLEDDPQLLGLAGLDLAVQVLERRAAAAVAGLVGGFELARLDERAGFLLVADDAQDVAGGRDFAPGRG